MSHPSEVHQGNGGDRAGGGRKVRHLEVVPATKEGRPLGRMLATRWGILGATIAALGMFLYSIRLPWWHFWLFAPQYPRKGLELVVSLTGVSGDVAEVNEINHYIGMKHLEDAAVFERQIAFGAIVALGVIVLVLTLAEGKRFAALSATIAAGLPLGFVADSWWWLRRFGHELDAHAAVMIKAFTPQMFGGGKIGQFETFATPETGFYLAAGAVLILAIASYVRSRVCASCAKAATCGAVCTSLFVGPGAGLAGPGSTPPKET